MSTFFEEWKEALAAHKPTNVQRIAELDALLASMTERAEKAEADTRLARAQSRTADITSGVLRRAWDFKAARVPALAEIDALLPLVGWHQVEWSQPRVQLPRAGMEIDFGGIGKEYAVDRVLALLTALLAGLFPALRASRIDAIDGLKSRGSLLAPRLRAGRVLVAAQGEDESGLRAELADALRREARARAGLHPPRAAADLGASLRRLLGLPAGWPVRADCAPRHARGFPLLRRGRP